MSKRLVLIKIGGSLITDRNSPEPKENRKKMEALAEEIREIFKEDLSVILLHGAGSYGHPLVKQHKLDRGLSEDESLREQERLVLTEVQVLQYELNGIFSRVLATKSIPTFPLQASASAIMNSELISMNCSVAKGLLEMGMVPFFYGVPAWDQARGISILSADTIARYLAVELGADLLVHLTEVGGVFDRDPHLEGPSPKLIGEIRGSELGSIQDGVTGSHQLDATGGMAKKLLESWRAAQSGCEVVITGQGQLKDGLEGRGGTWIRR